MATDIADLMKKYPLHQGKSDLDKALKSDFLLKMPTSVSTSVQSTSSPLYSETQTITLQPSSSKVVTLLSNGSGFLLDCTIFITNTGLPAIGTNNANTVQLSVLSWKGSGQASKIYLSSTNFIFTCKNRDVQRIDVTNNFSQSITINFIYTVKSNSDNVEATVDDVTQVVGQTSIINTPIPVVQTSLTTTFQNGVQYVVPIILTNSQSSSTGNNFQQNIQFPSSSYTNYESSNLSNINFQDGNGNILTSWIESGETNASAETSYWVLLPNGIGATSSITIYLCFYSTSSNLINGTSTGAEPNYTATYGQYDNGSSIFVNYWNFIGVAIPSSIGIKISGNGAVSMNNGISLYANVSSYALIYTSIASGLIAEFYSANGTANNQISFGYGKTSTIETFNYLTTNGVYLNQGYFAYTLVSGTSLIFAAGNSGLTNISNVNFSSGTPLLISNYYWVSSVQSMGIDDNTYSLSGTASGITPNTLNNFFIGQVGYSTSTYETTYTWLRTRQYPPSGTMPSVSLSQITLPSIAGLVIPWQISISSQNTNLLGVIINESTIVKSAQVVVGVTAVQLANNPCKGFVLKADDENTGIIYVGGSGVTTANGFPLLPSQGISYNASNTNILYVISNTSAQLVEWSLED